MTDLLALFVVLLTGLYLIGLSAVLWLKPARAARFLGGFASSSLTHYLEMVLRLIAGGAMVLYSPQMLFPGLFASFGWVLVVTTIGLIAVPWRWHRRFAQWAVPHTTGALRLLGVASFVFGGFVLVSIVAGSRPGGGAAASVSTAAVECVNRRADGEVKLTGLQCW